MVMLCDIFSSDVEKYYEKTKMNAGLLYDRIRREKVLVHSDLVDLGFSFRVNRSHMRCLKLLYPDYVHRGHITKSMQSCKSFSAIFYYYGKSQEERIVSLKKFIQRFGLREKHLLLPRLARIFGISRQIRWSFTKN